jgi:hypothetical protein
VTNGDPLDQALNAASEILGRLHDPQLLVHSRRASNTGATHAAVHPGVPIDLSVLDVQARTAELLGAQGDARVEIARLIAIGSQLDGTETAQVRRNTLMATAEGRIYLARRAGHTPILCPACGRRSVIPALEPGEFECQNDLCIPGVDENGRTPLRRFTKPSALGGSRYAQVTLAEVADFTGVSAKTWEQRLRRAKPRVRPVGKNSNGESLYLWENFEDWLDRRTREAQLVEKPLNG